MSLWDRVRRQKNGTNGNGHAIDPAPEITFRGAEVTVSNSIPGSLTHRHSRMWIQHLTGACAILQEETDRGIGDVAEKKRQIAEKQHHIAVHSAAHPDDSMDATYMDEHVRAAKGLLPTGELH